jgi:hypothetical protein
MYQKVLDPKKVVKIVTNEDYKDEMDFYRYAKAERIPTPLIYENENLTVGNFKGIIKDHFEGETLAKYIDTGTTCEKIPDPIGLDNLLNTLFKEIDNYVSHGKGFFIFDPHPRNIMYDSKQKNWVIVEGNLWDPKNNQYKFKNYMYHLIFRTYSENNYDLFKKCKITAGAYLKVIWEKIQKKFGDESVSPRKSRVSRYSRKSSISPLGQDFKVGECLSEGLYRIEDVSGDKISTVDIGEKGKNKPFPILRREIEFFEKTPCPKEK